MDKKIIIYILIVLVVIIGAFYLFRSSGSYGPSASPVPSADQTTPLATGVPTPLTSSIQPTPVAPLIKSSPTATATPDTASTKTRNVNINNFSFNPGTLNISKGDTVVWTNRDSAPHQVTGDNLNSPVISNGQDFSFVFNSSGTFAYHCAIHPSMKGTIIVK